MAFTLGQKVFVGGLLVLGAYEVLKPKKKKKAKGPIVKGIPVGPTNGMDFKPVPAEPAWQETFEAGIDAAILDAKADPEVWTLDDAIVYVVTRIFPNYDWLTGTPSAWQRTVMQSAQARIEQKAVQSLGWQSDPLAAAVFFLAVDKALAACIDVQGITEFDVAKACAAETLYPGGAWPPSGDSPTWMREAWGKLDNKTMLAFQARGM